MKITPLDLKKQVFRKVMRGYDPIEVRTFLDMVAEEFEKILKENISLSEGVRTLDKQIEDYKSMERAMNDALLSAQRALSESRENAKKEADLIIKDARIESEKIIQEARQESERLSDQVNELGRIKRESLMKLKSFLNEQLSLLSDFIESESVEEEGVEERKMSLNINSGESGEARD
ncbi:MAG: DivIVA domain-containing protein [Candidatus Glassbacteria bacterium]